MKRIALLLLLAVPLAAQEARERYLLPVLVGPIPGAYGSEFRTELHGLNTSTVETIDIWGLEVVCRYTPPICNWLEEPMVTLYPTTLGVFDIFDYAVYYTGTPGRFIEVLPEHASDLSLTLRVYDTSRAAENFGTEIPAVRTSAFRQKPFALVSVPLDARFRNTLRLYSTAATTVQVQIGTETHTVTLRAGEHAFDPAYAQFTSFPIGDTMTNVIVTPAENGPAVWGFISVTNNDTQHITTIAPH